MTPERLRARADREERVYAAPDLAKMLRAGADAMEERARLRVALKQIVVASNNSGLEMGTVGMRVAERVEDIAPAALTPPAEVYDSHDAKWEVTK